MGDGYWIKKKTLAMFSDVTAENVHVTPAAKLNDSPEQGFHGCPLETGFKCCNFLVSKSETENKI